MKKIAVVYHFFPHYRAAVLRELWSRYGDRLLLFAARKDPLTTIREWELPDGLPFVETRIVRLGNQALWQSGLLRLASRRDVANIIYLANPYWPATWLSAIIARVLGKRVFFWTHGWKREDHGVVRLIRNTYHRIAHGLLLYGHFAKCVGSSQGFPSERLHVPYHSIDYAAHASIRDSTVAEAVDAEMSKLGGDPRMPWVVCVARLIPERRLDMLIEAGALLSARGRPINILLVGEGPDETRLRDVAASHSAKVVFFGPCYDEETLAKLFMGAIATVAPAQMGLTALHSMAYGTPVITSDEWTDQGPEFEAIIPEMTGGLYRGGSVTDLSEQIERWILRADRSEIRKACVRVVERCWTPAAQVALIDRALRGCDADDLAVYATKS